MKSTSPTRQLYAAYLALRAAGEAHGLKLFGARAVESMRLEKGFLHWKADLLTEFDPFETGLDRVREGAPAHGGASVMLDGTVVGTITSGDWGHRVGKNLAYAFVEPFLAETGSAIEIDILGEMVPARIVPMGPYDPEYTRIRS
jgi:dimethylglycine dehydrogenase